MVSRAGVVCECDVKVKYKRKRNGRLSGQELVYKLEHDPTESIVSASINLYRELQMNLRAITWG